MMTTTIFLESFEVDDYISCRDSAIDGYTKDLHRCVAEDLHTLLIPILQY